MREMSDISLKYRKSDVPTHSKGFEGTWVSFLSVSIIFSVVKRSETVISDLGAEQATMAGGNINQDDEVRRKMDRILIN